MTLRMSTHSDTKNLDVHSPIFLTMCLQRANHAKVISQMLVAHQLRIFGGARRALLRAPRVHMASGVELINHEGRVRMGIT